METSERGKILSGLLGLVAGLNPMKSLTFLLAVGLTAINPSDQGGAGN
jgi:hypothetical protein